MLPKGLVYHVGQNENGIFETDGTDYKSLEDAILGAECLANWYIENQEEKFTVLRLPSYSKWFVWRGEPYEFIAHDVFLKKNFTIEVKLVSLPEDDME